MKKVLLAAPRGFCAGVDRAIDVVGIALDRYGPPVYVRKQIVHNTHVVSDLAARGAVFVDELDEVPDGAVVVFSAHGVAPQVREAARARGLTSIDATCPLVAKVHAEARRFARDGRRILLIGHAGHEEIDGTLGEAPANTTLIEAGTDLDQLGVPADTPVIWLSQTTLTVDEVTETVARLRARFPDLADPPSDDVCYASQNRQDAVTTIAARCDLVLVVGSANSSNSLRLVEVALAAGARAAHLVDDAGHADSGWLEGAATVGVTAGASAPEHLVAEVLAWLRSYGYADVEQVTVTEESIRFAVPPMPAVAFDRAAFAERVTVALTDFLQTKAGQWVEDEPRVVFAELHRFVTGGGKRIRPMFCYWGWRAAGGADGAPILTVAAGLELLHAALLIHDDVMDCSETRRGRPTLYRAVAGIHERGRWRGDPLRFGMNVAVDCGCLLMFWADEMYHTCGLEPARLRAGYPYLARMRTDVLIGQFLDLAEQAHGGTLDGALRVNGYKTGAYTVVGPLCLGAALAGADPATIAALVGFGRPLGEAFQLRDDLLGVYGDPGVTGKPNVDDLREGKPTALVALARAGADRHQAARIATLYGRAELTDRDAATLRQVIADTGAVRRVEDLIAARTGAALRALSAAPIDPQARTVLAELAVAATRRDQ